MSMTALCWIRYKFVYTEVLDSNHSDCIAGGPPRGAPRTPGTASLSPGALCCALRRRCLSR